MVSSTLHLFAVGSFLHMQAKLPLRSKTLQALSSIDPVVRGHSEAGAQLRKLADIMKHLVPQESDITQEIISPVPRRRKHGHVVGPCHEHREISSPKCGCQRCSVSLPWAHGGIIL